MVFSLYKGLTENRLLDPCARKHRNLKVKRVNFLYIKPQESVTDEGAKYLAEAFKDGNCTLNGLDLRRNNVTDEGIEYLNES